MLSRLDNIADDDSGTTKYAQYTYLGAGSIVKVAHPAVSGGLNLTYKGSASGSYDGWDRFGRVIDQTWNDDTPTPVVKDQYRYGYDYVSNRKWRENTLTHGQVGLPQLDEFYTYDGLHRLDDAEREEKRGEKGSGPLLGLYSGGSEVQWSLWHARRESIMAGLLIMC
jgi:hypothetical protein